MSFICSKCGICCSFVGLIVEKAKQLPEKNEILQEVANFPYKYAKSGRCEKLSSNNECTVYETRPLMCNVDSMHKKYFQEYSQEEFYRLNEKECDTLKKKQDDTKM